MAELGGSDSVADCHACDLVLLSKILPRPHRVWLSYGYPYQAPTTAQGEPLFSSASLPAQKATLWQRLQRSLRQIR